jgi:hypothetical protein
VNATTYSVETLNYKITNMYRTRFSPDVRNIGGRNIIVGTFKVNTDGVVAHTMNLYKIIHRTPDHNRKRLNSQQNTNRKSYSKYSKTSESKHTLMINK